MAKVLLSIDERLVRRIDAAARARGMSRSAFISEIAARALEERRGPGSTARARAALARLDRLFANAPLGEGTEAIRAERDARSAG